MLHSKIKVHTHTHTHGPSCLSVQPFSLDLLLVVGPVGSSICTADLLLIPAETHIAVHVYICYNMYAGADRSEGTSELMNTG